MVILYVFCSSNPSSFGNVTFIVISFFPAFISLFPIISTFAFSLFAIASTCSSFTVYDNFSKLLYSYVLNTNCGSNFSSTF